MNTHHRAGHLNNLQTEGATIRWARFYDVVVKLMSLGQDKALRRATVEMAGVKPGDKVLDVGCGTGDLTLAAAQRAGTTGQVVGIDAAPEMIAVAQRKAARLGGNVIFQAGLIEHLSFPDNSFDLVLSSLMMHHLPGDLKRQGLLEIRRVLKPGGRLFIVDFQRSHSSPHGNLRRLLSHFIVHGAVLPELPGMMKEAGFVQVTSGDTPLPGVGFATGHAPQDQ